MHYSINTNENSNHDLSAQIDTICSDPTLSALERWIRLAGLAEYDSRIAPILRQRLYRELHRPGERQAVLKALADAERRRNGPLAEMMRNIAAYRSGSPEVSTEIKSPSIPSPELHSEPAEIPSDQICIRLDSEIGRMATGLSLDAQFRIWASIRQHAGARGYVDIGEIQQLLADWFDVRHGIHYLRKLLRKGSGIFWGLTRDRQRVFYRGAAKVGAALVRLAKQQGREELYDTNLPGGRDVWVPAQSSLQNWKAHIYAAWFAWRENPQIARSTLCSLFGVSKETLYNWDALLDGVLRTRRNEAQTTCCNVEQLPVHATQYMTWRKETRYRWQLSNTYISTLKVHPHKGQARRVRELAWREAYGQPVKAPKAQAGQPASTWFDRTHRTLRRYHTSLGRVQHFVKLEARIEERSGIPKGFRKQQMYLWRGENGQKRGIYEYIPLEAPYGEIPEDWQPETKADERVPLKVEYRRDWLGDYKRSEREYLCFRRAQGELA